MENQKSKKGKVILSIFIIVLILCAAAAAAYFFVFAKPQYVFKKALNKVIKADDKSYTSFKLDTAINVSGELEDDEYDDIMKEISKCILKVGTQIDLTTKEEVVNLGLTYDNKEVISLKEYYDCNEMFLYFDKVFDKNIKVDVPEDVKEEINELFDDSVFGINKDALKIYVDEFNKNLEKNAKYSQEKTTETINGNSVELTKSTMEIAETEIYNVMSTSFKNLSENEEFLSYYDESKKESLVELSEEYANKAFSANEKNIITISIYSEGILYSFKGFEIAVKEEDFDFVAFKISKNEYEFSAKDGEEKVIEGTLEETKEGFILNAKLKDVGTVKIKVNYEVSYDTEVDKIDKENSISTDELTESDYEKILSELSERPLIGDYITEYLDSYNNTTNVTYENDLNTEKNEVRDYGYDVKYVVPSDYEYDEEYADDTYKMYTKDLEGYKSLDVKTMMRYATSEDYVDEIKYSCDYYTKNNYYTNVKMSEVEETEVEGKKFKYATLDYESNYQDGSSEYVYRTLYIWYELDESVLYTVEVDANDKTTNITMFKDFLTITTAKVND